MTDKKSNEPSEFEGRINGLAIGIMFWGVRLSIILTVWPDRVANWIQTAPYQLAGASVLISMGIVGYAFDLFFRGLEWLTTSNTEKELTTPPWEEE